MSKLLLDFKTSVKGNVIPTVAQCGFGLCIYLFIYLFVSGDRRLEVRVSGDGSGVSAAVHICLCAWHDTDHSSSAFNLRHDGTAGVVWDES